MPDLKCLTTKEVARLCRVSDATVKRWEDAGLLFSERTSGGHRRFRAVEVVRFQREQNLGLKKSHGDESVVSAIARRRENKNSHGTTIFQSLIAGCEEAAADEITAEYLKGKSLVEIFDASVCPAMRRVGELWVTGKLSISQEHLATRIAHNSIYKLRNNLPVSKLTGKLAFCCAVEGDFHELPTHFAQITIENEGWEALNFGANTPFKCLTKEISQRLPQVVCISANIIADVQTLSREYKCFSERLGKLQIPIILGGRAFKENDIQQHFPADFFAQNFTEVADFVQRLTKKL